MVFRFKDCNFDLKDMEHLGRPPYIDDDQFSKIIKKNRFLCKQLIKGEDR